MIHSAINNATSPQKENASLLTAFTERPLSTPLSTFLCTADSVPITPRDPQRGRAYNVTVQMARMDKLQPFVDNSVALNRSRMQN